MREDYAGAFIYKNGTLDYVLQEEGRIIRSASLGRQYRHEYHYRDHLGNLRLAYTDADSDGVPEVTDVLQEAHPFTGLRNGPPCQSKHPPESSPHLPKPSRNHQNFQPLLQQLPPQFHAFSRAILIFVMMLHRFHTLRLLSAALLAFMLMAPASPATAIGHFPAQQGNEFCNLHGAVFVEPVESFARYKVFVEDVEAFADILVFKEYSKSFADHAGLWHFTDSRSFADFSIAFTDVKGFADFSIYYTEFKSLAGCRK